MSLWAILMASLAVAANMAGQIMAYRLLPANGKLFKSQIAGALIGGLVLALLLSAAPGAVVSADAAIADALLYLAFCYVYFHWNNMGETARRIRMLRELAAAPEGLTFEDMVARYSAQEILERRLERLTAADQISESDGRLVLTSRSVLLSARLVGLAKQVIFGGRSELDEHDHITL
jgi:hypothetical protein